jgi:hypothetical protein
MVKYIFDVEVEYLKKFKITKHSGVNKEVFTHEVLNTVPLIHPDVDDQLTYDIQRDRQLPSCGKLITVDILHLFAEWQKTDRLKLKYFSE